MYKMKIFNIIIFIVLSYVFFVLFKEEIGFYLSAINRGYKFPILKTGLAITILYLLFCLVILSLKLNNKRIIDKHILFLQLKMILGQVILMVLMFFIRMKY